MEKKIQPQNLLNKYLPEILSPVPDNLSEEDMFEAIRKRVKELLDKDMQRLLHMLYRIDVPESVVRKILAVSDPDVLDADLTEVILIRLKQKIAFRNTYRQS